MKLRERFFKILETTAPTLNKVDSATCEKIANNNAIEFAQWVLDGNISNFLDSPVELLEVYKKEKEL